MNLQLHLTDDTQLRARGFVADYTLVAEVCWQHPILGSCWGMATLRGTPAMMRQLAELATQAAIQAEEEACWQAHQAATAIPEQGRVA